MMNKDAAQPPRSRQRRILYGIGIVVGLVILSGFLVISVVYKNYSVPTGAMERSILAGYRILARHASFSEGVLPPRGIPIIFYYPGDRDEVEPQGKQVYVERCVAVAGDVLEIRNGQILINGAPESLPKTAWFDSKRPQRSAEALYTFPKGYNYTRDNWGPMRIPKKGDVIPLSDTNLRAWRIFIEREGHSVRQNETAIMIDGKIATSYRVERDYVFGIGDNRNDSQDSRYWGFIPAENIVGTPFKVYFSTDPVSGDIRWSRIFADIR